ncbi:UDP-glucose 4-epimerase GalE [Yoonia maritima]|uniref:UDP-glucose 4-epimerase GalE n=1 Tax=Yoonia maritima TaxID=1435347 RepID=UPI003735A201
MRVLLTGGAGYIGSHTLLKLLQEQNEVLVLDNFSNSSMESLRRVKQLANRDFDFRNGDICNSTLMNDTFNAFKPDAVIHFAGLKAVGESNDKPLDYYTHNVTGSVELLRCMRRHGCKQIVFSSSATVYGEADYLPYDEQHPLRPTNPYGRTKYFVEEIIKDWTASWSEASAVLLRYFNPVGAHDSGRIGEDPLSTPNNLVPFISQVAIGRLDKLNVFGSDYDTRDGTGERDYIHVDDLARAHLSAVHFASKNKACEAINVGTGRGATVLEMVKAFERASGRPIPLNMAARRNGDVAKSIADVSKANRLLDWEAIHNIDDMCRSTWNWQSLNPLGYK